MASIRDIPEVAGIHSSRGVVRIPPELDVPLTDRVTRLLDAAAMRRLAGIPQLGLVRLVYPGATHSRLEHSLGVYRNALLFLNRLAEDDRFASLVAPERAESAIVAALLHDVGHWPFCHAIEDLQIDDLPTHEELARRFVEQD
ncbi:MAG: HD domain-containing protein, partial [Planctomycetota bacterium]